MAATETRPRAQRDPCVVASAPLAALLRRLVARWGETDGGRFAPGDTRSAVPVMAAVAWLAQESGVPEETISNICRGRYRTTELRVADALLTAIGRPDLLHTELVVMPNPIASRAARASCCGSPG